VVVVARAPDQVRPQGDRGQPVVVGRQDHALRDGLGPGIGRVVPPRVRDGFVHALHVAAVEDDARRAREDELSDAVGVARGDDVLRADDVRAVEVFVSPPDAGSSGDVEDGVAAAAGGGHVKTVLQVAADDFDAGCLEVGVGPPREAADPAAAGEQSLDDRPAEEAAPARYEDGPQQSVVFYRSCAAAHTASFSLKIFALCRISTGNAG